MEVRNAIMFHSLEILNTNSGSQATKAVSRAADCGANDAEFEPRPQLRFLVKN